MAAGRFSRGDLLVLVSVLAASGAAVSAYLVWQWYDAANSTWCDLDSYFSCTRVRESPFSAVAGVPLAFVGVLGFAILLGLSIAPFRRVERVGPMSTEQALVLVAFLGAVIGAGLTAVEILVIQAICILCAVGFGLDLAILAAAGLLRRTSGTG